MVEARQKMVQIPLTEAQQNMVRDLLGVEVECKALNISIKNPDLVKYMAPPTMRPGLFHMYLEPWQTGLISTAVGRDLSGMKRVELLKEGAQKAMYRPLMLFD
jgi:hypothetical protein